MVLTRYRLFYLLLYCYNVNVNFFEGDHPMKRNKCSTKRHIWFYEFERMWLFLTVLNVVAIFLIIRGSTAPLIIDNDVFRFLFYTPETSDKTFYNIAISYFAAYIFFIIQVYYPERRKTKRALISIEIPVFNLINQTNMFLFVWETFTERNSPDDGTILGVNISEIYYKNSSGRIMSADKNELGDIVKRVRSAYCEITEDISFQGCDNSLRRLLLEKNVPEEMNRLYQVLLSAELLAKNDSTTILESYLPEDVEDIRARLKKLDELFDLECDLDYVVTTDKSDIKKRKKVKEDMLQIILENFDYFSNLPDSYRDTLK